MNGSGRRAARLRASCPRRILWPTRRSYGGRGLSGEAPDSSNGQPTAPRTSSNVFISYASRDAAVATSIVDTLEQQGLKCWLAPRDVKAGAPYADAIVRAINEASAVVLVLSASAVV